jgi:hypothetical protein
VPSGVGVWGLRPQRVQGRALAFGAGLIRGGGGRRGGAVSRPGMSAVSWTTARMIEGCVVEPRITLRSSGRFLETGASGWRF